MAEPMILNPSDNVAILTERGVAPAGHKIARRAIATGEPVFKYGQIIGYATADISAGDHVHSHNCAFGDHDRAHRPGAQVRQHGHVSGVLRNIRVSFLLYFDPNQVMRTP